MSDTIVKQISLDDLIVNKYIFDSFQGVDVVSIDKSNYGQNQNEKLNYNLYGLARSNNDAKEVVVRLSNLGFYLVEHKQGVSTFFNYKNKKLFDNIFLKENVFKFGEIYYSIEFPVGVKKPSRLLVILSSVSDLPYNADIQRRCFNKNFPSAGKYIPYDTAILRISDVGGVVGSFYINNNSNNKIEMDIVRLLESIDNLFEIKRENVVLYGGSKGGFAALYYGMLCGLKFISVDPMVTDDYHQKTYNDSHFTKGTFPVSKQDKIKNLLKKGVKKDFNGYIVTSKKSPIYNYIDDFDFPDNCSLVDVRHKDITNHVNVSLNTINIVTMLFNLMLYSFNNKGSLKIFHEQ